MSLRRASDDRYERKLALLRDAGAVRTAVTPLNPAALLELSDLCGQPYDALMGLDDIALGELVWIWMIKDDRLLPENSEVIENRCDTANANGDHHRHLSSSRSSACSKPGQADDQHNRKIGND